MQKKLLFLIPAIFVLLAGNAQKLQTFTETMQYDGKAYLSIKNSSANLQATLKKLNQNILFFTVTAFLYLFRPMLINMFLIGLINLLIPITSLSV